MPSPSRSRCWRKPGDRHGRWSANQGSFVRYEEEHSPGLDFATPPGRPDPQGLTDRIRKILDEADAKRGRRVSPFRGLGVGTRRRPEPASHFRRSPSLASRRRIAARDGPT